ncbi:hypothetical protein TKK_0004737 [Trichogramma kaykai]|uniref:F-box domain-containing protein n=1 Tax=Trichogramma kaykai TaxID=54128 RepID=A0ABD2XKN6_9HYME
MKIKSGEKCSKRACKNKEENSKIMVLPKGRSIEDLNVYCIMDIFRYLEPSDLIHAAEVWPRLEEFSCMFMKKISATQFVEFILEQKTVDDIKKIFPYLKYLPHIILSQDYHQPSISTQDFEKLCHEIFELLSKSKNDCLKTLDWDFQIPEELVQNCFKAIIHNLEVIDVTDFNRITISSNDIRSWLQNANNLKEFNWEINSEEQQNFLLPTLECLPKTLRIIRICILGNVSRPISVELLFEHLNQMSNLDNLVLSRLDFKLTNERSFHTTARTMCFVVSSGTNYSCLPVNPNLKKLTLESGILTDKNLDFILENYSSLEILILSYLDTTEAVIGRFSQLERLKILKFESMNDWIGSTLKFFTNLEELDIRYCRNFRKEFLFDWLPRAKNLRLLKVIAHVECEWDELIRNVKNSSRVRNQHVTIEVGTEEKITRTII